MATQRQIEANRRNALKSTGPRTAAGKTRSSQNSFIHGFSARTIALDPQSSRAFLELRDHWLAQYPAANEPQRETLGQIAVTLWHLGRLAEFEAKEYRRQAAVAEERRRQKLQTLLDLDADGLNQPRLSGQPVIGRLVDEYCKPVAEAPVIGLPPDRYGRYEGSLKRTLFRLLRKMRRLEREEVRAVKNLKPDRSQIAAGDAGTKGFGAIEADRVVSSNDGLPLPVRGERVGERALARSTVVSPTMSAAQRPSPPPSPRVQGEGGR